MLSKEQRQQRIQEIITQTSISTQNELVQQLHARGICVTQATVSRDINELGVVRVPIGKGKHRYALAQVGRQSNVLEELKRLFHDFVHDIDRGENILAIRTADGHATGVALLLDQLRRDDIVGTIAGEDTIIVIARSVAEGEVLLEELYSLLLDT